MYYNLQLAKRNRVFTYKSNKDIAIGTYCLVDFANKQTKGIIVEKFDKINVDYEIKEIQEVLVEKLDEKLFELIKWIHDYYLEPYGSLISLIEKPENVEEYLIENAEKNIEYCEINLNDEQEKVLNDIEKSNDRVHLINGITGSGKTEVYMKLIQNAIKSNHSSIILVPEISLTTQLCERLEKVFKDEIAIWHSKLSKNQKLQYYNSLSNGDKKVLLGARSAIFCKMKNLKYIIIDEEHENTYKQEESPRYHVKNVAIKRAILENAKVILASATPSFETMYQVEQKAITQHILSKRYNNATLPEYITVDLNEEKTLLSNKLIEKINEKIQKQEQTIILLNRKAYSIRIKCNDCKKDLECNNCTFSLTYYNKKNILKCNQCGLSYKMQNKCKSCNSEKLIKLGIGTEKLEEQLKEVFDENRILRMDADSMNTKSKLEKAYKQFLNNKYDILIGTQILAKGFHFPNVTLVCIINADQLANFPDYKINEKTYQLITQAAGRAGRGEKKGEVLIQSYNTDSSLIHSIINNDYNKLYTEQMNLREKLFYPPYSKNIKVLITDTNEKRLEKISQEIYKQIYSNISNYAKIYPVSHAFVYKISKRYRNNINIILDRKNEKKVKSILKNIVHSIKLTSTRILIDVDPTTML